VTTPGIETTGYFGRTLLGVEMHVSGIVHEMGHGMGFEHSYSERPDHTAPMGNTHMEYGDPFDIMSLNSVFHTQGQWGPTGPRMNSYNLDRMGWVARNEAVNFGADGRTQSTYTLTPLYQSWPGGVRLVRIPFDPADPFHYYVVEMRQNSGLDAAFAMHRVLIYEVKPLPGQGYLQGFLLRVNTLGDAIQSLQANGVTIEINSIAANGSSAVITVKGHIAKMCAAGFVPRNAGPSDNVCVPQASRDQVLAENNSYFGLISRCRPPLVQRQAFANDRVCVTQERYEEVQQENALARERNAAQAFRGINACAAGYVWREAGPRDYVCVTPIVRNQTLEENRLAPTRQVRLPFTSGYICAQGFVRREAFLGDGVCAPDSSRLRAIQDNAAAANRLLHR
jgi:hypothetical protein